MNTKNIGPTIPGMYTQEYRNTIHKYINMKLSFLHGYHVDLTEKQDHTLSLSNDLIENYREKRRLLSSHLCPVDTRILTFLKEYLKDTDGPTPNLPRNTLILDRHGLARELSLPKGKDQYLSNWVKSHKVEQGIVNNPVHDRRTTKGVFHIVEGGLSIPADKKAVPKKAFSIMLNKALSPPEELATLPWLSENDTVKKELFVSLLLRPKVVPEVPGFISEKKLEVRFFAPGGLVSNLDFVESIFGNAGDPEVPQNNAALDPEHWTGHTGCVILAPHLITLTKKELGLPHFDQATERQKRDGMCWKNEDELYNEGSAFKICCRDHKGVVVTLIADNYYGYCKKEVKTQIGYSANLYGLAEEEHAGGAVVFPSYQLGAEFHHKPQTTEHSFLDVCKNLKDVIDIKENYAIDKNYPNLIYVPESTSFDINTLSITYNGQKILKLLADKTYMLPTGYRVHLEKHPKAPSWRLIGTEPEGTLCHKPSTVSGGGKSEISKAFSDSYIFGSFFIDDLQKDFELVQEIFDRDYALRFKNKSTKNASRQILDPNRSLGSVIKLLTISPEYNEDFNDWLKSIPSRILSLVFIIKRFYKKNWGNDWRNHFTVDQINGEQGHELKLDGRKISAVYSRMGYEKDGSWRTFKLRQDFVASQKIQVEDDITVSITVPSNALSNKNTQYKNESLKLVENCENRLFQRPDEAIHRGYDKQAENDLSSDYVFISNFEPMNHEQAIDLIEDAINFDTYTQPMKDSIQRAYNNKGWFISSAHPRLVDGIPTKNPRYLQTRPDLVNPYLYYLAHTGTRLKRKLNSQEKVQFPVNSVLMGHRNNPPDKEKGIRSLAVYNPIHFLDTPELFMDFICSLTGKSPSTTGAGSEGAMTKGPFNALCTAKDLNNAYVSYLLTGYSAYCSAAGHIGPNYQIDHDVSLFIPELWARIATNEGNHQYLIDNGFLEPCDDFTHDGKTVHASRLGHRINHKFVSTFMGKIFDNPLAVFNEAILKPETQDLDSYVDGINNIVEAQQKVALNYFKDGGYEQACPPIQILLHIMAYGHYNNKTLMDPDLRSEFTKDKMLESSWYQQRLTDKQNQDISFWKNSIQTLKDFLAEHHDDIQFVTEIQNRLNKSKKNLSDTQDNSYLEKLKGTIGLNPI